MNSKKILKYVLRIYYKYMLILIQYNAYLLHLISLKKFFNFYKIYYKIILN